MCVEMCVSLHFSMFLCFSGIFLPFLSVCLLVCEPRGLGQLSWTPSILLFSFFAPAGTAAGMRDVEEAAALQLVWASVSMLACSRMRRSADHGSVCKSVCCTVCYHSISLALIPDWLIDGADVIISQITVTDPLITGAVKHSGADLNRTGAGLTSQVIL